MSSDNTASDTMRRDETDQDSGDTGTETSSDPQPVVSHPPEHLGNDDSDAPVPMATPQSPVQTEDSASEDRTPEVRDDAENAGTLPTSGREYREV